MVLLPSEATAYEAALTQAIAPTALVASTINAMRRIKYVSPRPSMLPFLVWEYGLGELTPYVPNLYNLVDQGVRWQRLRGTVSAVAIGLAWIGYTATIEAAWTGRAWWNSFQLRFDTLPPRDMPDLERIEGITRLSVPKRSQLRRGVYLYDASALEADRSRLDGSMLDFESGIAVTQAGTIWSFGRPHEFSHLLTEAEGRAIGNWQDEASAVGSLQWGDGFWIDEPEAADSVSWEDLTIPWETADFPWETVNAAEARRNVMALWFQTRPLYLRLSGASGVIGYRRCRAVRSVIPALAGSYEFAGQGYLPSSVGEILYVEGMTDFGDADQEVCTSIALMVGGSLPAGVKPGKAWLAPNQYSGGTAIAVQSTDIPLRATVRERIKLLMRF